MEGIGGGNNQLSKAGEELSFILMIFIMIGV
jgi:hypothetical protein